MFPYMTFRRVAYVYNNCKYSCLPYFHLEFFSSPLDAQEPMVIQSHLFSLTSVPVDTKASMGGRGRCVCQLLSCVRLFATPQTVARQALLSMEFSRHKYWSGLPFPSPGDHPDPGTEPKSPALQADSLPSELPEKPYLWDFKYINNLSYLKPLFISVEFSLHSFQRKFDRKVIDIFNFQMYFAKEARKLAFSYIVGGKEQLTRFQKVIPIF